MPDEFEIKDSGARESFEGGMVRDTADDKVDYSNVAYGPMLYRWAQHCTRGREKYPDPAPGVPNWTLAKGMVEHLRFKASAFRHFMAWFWGLRDEDHAAGVFFNVNGAEYTRALIEGEDCPIVMPGPPMAPSNPRRYIQPKVTSEENPEAECASPNCWCRDEA